MTRPPRILFPGALYHVTSRGNRKADIYLDRRDHLLWLDFLAETVERFQFVIHAYCMMPNHYHLTLETVEPNLSDGMHYLNSTYAQRFNKRHGLVGHVIQGRFHAVLVQRDTHLLELTRYLPLNPVRARIVKDPGDWPWSSYEALAGRVAAPSWLQTDWTLAQFSTSDRKEAFMRFVEAGRTMRNPLLNASEHTNLAGGAPPTLRQIADSHVAPHLGMAKACQTKAYTMAEIAAFFGVSVKTVSRAAKRYS